MDFVYNILKQIKETFRQALFEIMVKSQENMYKQQGKWEQQKAKQEARIKELKEKFNIDSE